MNQFDVEAWLENRNGCEGSCTTPEAPVTVAPDPYAFEIHGDDTEYVMCIVCRRERKLEV